MKFFTTAVAAVGAFAAAGAATVAIANADAGDAAPSTHPIGTQGTVENGGVIQGWTVSDLRPSSDAIPYQPRGTLWEATATDVAIQGTVIPVIANLGARSASGQTYPALFTVPTAQGVNPANLTQGQRTTGKVYFDVTGDAPDSAVYQGSGQDLLVWTPPPTPAGGPAGPAATGAQHSSGPAATGAKPTQSGTQGVPAATETVPTAAGSQGTPLPANSQGTPLPTEADGTPAAVAGSESGSEIAPAPSSQQLPGTPAQSENAAAAGSSGTPLPAEASGTSTSEAAGSTGTTGASGTAGSSGTSGTEGNASASGSGTSTTSH